MSGAHIVDLTPRKSLETFIGESSETIKKALGRYVDNLAWVKTSPWHFTSDKLSHSALFSTNLQLTSHGAQQVEKVSTGRDMGGVHTYIGQSLASSIPNPIPYHNFYVGECRDLIFGFSLQDYATSRDLPEGEIPKIVRICIEEVDRRGLDSEGIYRVSPSRPAPSLFLALTRKLGIWQSRLCQRSELDRTGSESVALTLYSSDTGLRETKRRSVSTPLTISTSLLRYSRFVDSSSTQRWCC